MAVSQDILLSANRLIHKYGDKAEEHAIQKHWEFKQKKDEAAANAWWQIIQGLKELRQMKPHGKLDS